MLKSNHKFPLPEEGFSLLEVLVAAFVIVGFLLGSLQAVTLATILRVQAQAKSEALNWINQNKSQIEYEAFAVPPPTGTPPTFNANCNVTNFRTYLNGLYSGDTGTSTLTSSTTSSANVTGLSLVNKPTYRVARYYRIVTNSNNSPTLEITWHLWDEGASVNATNPNLGGTGGDSDDRSIAVITSSVVPNVQNCN